MKDQHELIAANTTEYIERKFDRRVKIVRFTRELSYSVQLPLDRWFKITGLPQDAVLVGFFPDYPTNCFCAVIWSTEFEQVRLGEQIPTIEMKLEIRLDEQTQPSS